MNTAKACVAIIVLVAGIVLLFEGTYPAVEEWIDGVYIALGVTLFLSYFWLIGDYLERRLRATKIITIVPPLLVLGSVMLYYGVARAGLTTLMKLTFAIPGLVLVAVSLLMFYRTTRK